MGLCAVRRHPVLRPGDALTKSAVRTQVSGFYIPSVHPSSGVRLMSWEVGELVCPAGLRLRHAYVLPGTFPSIFRRG